MLEDGELREHGQIRDRRRRELGAHLAVGQPVTLVEDPQLGAFVIVEVDVRPANPTRDVPYVRLESLADAREHVVAPADAVAGLACSFADEVTLHLCGSNPCRRCVALVRGVDKAALRSVPPRTFDSSWRTCALGRAVPPPPSWRDDVLGVVPAPAPAPAAEAEGVRLWLAEESPTGYLGVTRARKKEKLFHSQLELQGCVEKIGVFASVEAAALAFARFVDIQGLEVGAEPSSAGCPRMAPRDVSASHSAAAATTVGDQLFDELVAISPVDELPRRSEYTLDDGTLNEDDLRADLQERRREAAAAETRQQADSAASAAPTVRAAPPHAISRDAAGGWASRAAPSSEPVTSGAPPLVRTRTEWISPAATKVSK